MSEDATALAAIAQARVLRFYTAIAILMLVVIGILIVYSIRLGPLVGPGVEQSFGFAVAMMFLAGAMLAHIADWTYRVWPEGRRVRTPVPSYISDRGIALAIKLLILVVVGAGIAYVLATLLS